MQEFSLGAKEFIPLCDLLKLVGLCQSGGQAKMFIAEGQVKVDGVIETRKRCKIKENQIIEFMEQKIKVIR